MGESIDVAYLYSAPLVSGIQRVDNIDVTADMKIIANCLTEANRTARVRFESATIDNLRTVITKGVKVLHYSGHGLPDLCLAFENGAGGLHANFSIDKLRALFSAGRTQVDFVFVAACHSEYVGHAFAAAGVPHVVAVRCAAAEGEPTLAGTALSENTGLVSDRASRVFSHAFYLALLLGRTVQQAFEIGRARVIADNDLVAACDAEKFLLLPKTVDHNHAIFVNQPVGLWQDVTPRLLSCLPPVCDYFTGRNKDVHAILASLLSRKRRLTIIRGPEGIGKSSVAVSVSHYLSQRRLMAVVFVDVRESRTPHEVLLATLAAIRTAKHQQQQREEARDSSTNSMSSNSIEALTTPVDHQWSHAELLNHIRSEILALKLETHLLIVLDGAEGLLREHRAAVCNSVLQPLLDKSECVKLLVVAVSSLGKMAHIAPYVHFLQPLTPAAALRMFSALCPRPVSGQEVAASVRVESVGKEIEAVVTFLRQRPELIIQLFLLSHLRGSPGAISLAASLLEDMTFAQLQALIVARTPRPPLPVVPDIVLAQGGAAKPAEEVAVDLTQYPFERPPSHAVSFPEHISEYLYVAMKRIQPPALTSDALQTLATIQELVQGCVPAVDASNTNAAGAAADSPSSGATAAEQAGTDNSDSKTDARSPSSSHKAPTKEEGSAAPLDYVPMILETPVRTVSGGDDTKLGEADTLRSLAMVKIQKGEVNVALQHLADAIAIYSAQRDLCGEAIALQLKTEVCMANNIISVDSKTDLDRALHLFQEANDLRAESWTLQMLAELNLLFVQERSGVDKWDKRMAESQRHAMEAAQHLVERSLMMFRQLHDANGEAAALRVRGRVSLSMGNRREGKDDLEIAHTIFAKLNNTLGDAATLRLLGGVNFSLRDYEAARRDFMQALEKYRFVKHRQGEMQCLRSLGDLYLLQGDNLKAVECLQGALAILDTCASHTRVNQKDKALVLRSLGETFAALGNISEGVRHLESAVPLFRELKRWQAVKHTLALSLRLTNQSTDKELAKQEHKIPSNDSPSTRPISMSGADGTTTIRVRSVSGPAREPPGISPNSFQQLCSVM